MAEIFDPYHKWLGIPPRDQPANYYRLLSIELFESDRDVIDAAARRVAIYVKGCATGPHQADAKKLLGEIVAARTTLIDPQRRAAYDQQLASPPPGVPAAAGGSAAGLVPSGAAGAEVDQPPPPPEANWGTPLSDTDMDTPPPPPAPADTIGDLPGGITMVPSYTPLPRSKKSGAYKNVKPAKAVGSDSPAVGSKRRKRQQMPGWVMIAGVLGVVAIVGILVAVFSSAKVDAPVPGNPTKVADKTPTSTAAKEKPPAAAEEEQAAATEDESTEYEDVAASDAKRALAKPGRGSGGGASGKLAEAIETGASLTEIQSLVASGVDLKAKDAQGRTPLRLAVVKGRADVVKALLAKKVDPNAPDLHGETPLMSAAQAGNAGILKLLLDAGADPNEQTDVRLAPAKATQADK